MHLSDGRVVTNFIVQALNNFDITVYGEGNQTRSFSYVEDTVNGLLLALNYPKSDIFNIGNDNEMSISPNVGALNTYLTKIVTNPL